MKIKVMATISLLALFLIGCSSSHQFIDVDEALLIKPGMSKAEIRTTLGKPTEVRAGIVLKNNDVIELWRYQMKEMQRKQVVDINKILPAFITKKQKPDKEFNPNDWSGENRYGLVFKNDKLIKWGYMGDDWSDYSHEQGDELPPASSKPQEKGGSSGGLLSKIPIVGGLLSKIPIIGNL